MSWPYYLIGNLIGVGLILCVIWWFWLVNRQKNAVRASTDVVEIIVDGGVYLPDAIRVKRGSTLTLRFLRKDEAPCASSVIFSELNQSAELPVGQPVDIKLVLKKIGEFEFTCQMGMYRGRLIVEE